ncbi:single-stranded DNA-binding protein [Staphylococcus massiliensis]|uniref:Single-stranded DNA-binding protein n=1 Tax=Staphylococcus massiliensis S46 TaxID=1229783 RepID=K9AX51_9STAP|nr:single-stranded DNA-binding protein [Staphylococcus massiliensis]EKU47152.1 ssDNA-binding protein [Staphylococcus massiliensis S46]MCG3400158.1 single-stranded DNA-binding protein [Staphylococcus massiliensis]MCG3402725.1 single-stranded DNA-binding protein [Staphylococcus massiliensis]PNZ97641.1 single-stranded DNA-binding protein [Staphylococcus massiliensis CCUG 55927]
MINKIVIVGRITKDPQLFEKEDKRVVSFCVATERNYKNEDDEMIYDFHLCKAFGKTATNIKKYTKQGSIVGVTGQMQTRQYEKDDKKHYSTELVVDTIKFMSPLNPKKDQKPKKETDDLEQILSTVSTN